MIQEPVRYEDLIQVISKWSPALKFNLIQDLLKSLEPEVTAIQPAVTEHSAPTLHSALGLLATDSPPPSDDEIEQILFESRLDKYN